MKAAELTQTGTPHFVHEINRMVYPPIGPRNKARWYTRLVRKRIKATACEPATRGKKCEYSARYGIVW